MCIVIRAIYEQTVIDGLHESIDFRACAGHKTTPCYCYVHTRNSSTIPFMKHSQETSGMQSHLHSTACRIRETMSTQKHVMHAEEWSRLPRCVVKKTALSPWCLPHAANVREICVCPGAVLGFFHSHLPLPMWTSSVRPVLKVILFSEPLVEQLCSQLLAEPFWITCDGYQSVVWAWHTIHCFPACRGEISIWHTFE